MEKMQPTAGLVESVFDLGRSIQGFSDSDLSQPYRWKAHQEGVRFALIGAMHELRTLAVHLASERRHIGQPYTRVHHALAQYNAAFRDLDAMLIGTTDAQYEQLPAPGEWPLRYVYSHMVGAERNFFALVHYGIRRQREGGEMSPRLPDDEANRLIGSFEVFNNLMENGSQTEMAAYHAVNRERALADFAVISDDEIDGPSLWWEGEPYSVEYRLHRMEAHLRQHTIQVEKTFDQLGRPANEARRLIRLVFAALAEVENVLIGVTGIGDAELAAAAAAIRQLGVEAVEAVDKANSTIAAVTSGNRERVSELITRDPQMANVLSRDGVPIVRLALYYGQKEIAGILADSPGIELEICDGAALGRLSVVEEHHKGWGDYILNEYGRDGYTPLQLASFFGNEEVARYLLAHGADVHATSMNPMAIQPLHAAAASDHEPIVRLLLQAGADPNAPQQDSFRPLHAAAQNGNAGIARLLLDHGADPTLPDAQDRLPRALAEEGGHMDVVELLTDWPG